jgi:hypothetical protein
MKQITNFISALIVCSLPATSVLHANIIYSGSLNINGPDFSLDINTDGLTDFSARWNLMASGNGISSSSYKPDYNMNMQFLHDLFLPPSTVYSGAVAPLFLGDEIGASTPEGLKWSNSGNEGMLWTKYDSSTSPAHTYSGIWNDVQNGYLGFALNINEQPHYGWIHLTVSDTNNLTLIDFAYNDAANQSILAGSIPEPSHYPIIFGTVSLFLALYRRK